ncbi:hypothetical protein BCIN_02g01410 [Botrytis cinerea B05.10]|uniref:Uncharacterized protein n=1 Tax=Botryotinia fuckeliana (strain B05.10) TaxID=332648 RepID=A0A384J8B6_BOTFB|nr:hypothetical protein BCIN_02g01410 [Botrytis cinerea B05.10]ATZ46779.1 hypothetical protein BCIN_02g01410 [Botrytis cinerea B05.10]
MPVPILSTIPSIIHTNRSEISAYLPTPPDEIELILLGAYFVYLIPIASHLSPLTTHQYPISSSPTSLRIPPIHPSIHPNILNPSHREQKPKTLFTIRKFQHLPLLTPTYSPLSPLFHS